MYIAFTSTCPKNMQPKIVRISYKINYENIYTMHE